jgi:hypothetical protein
MRILLATDAWEPQVNGVVRTLTRVVEELRAMGHEVDVVSPDQFPTFPLPTYPEIKLAIGAYEPVDNGWWESVEDDWRIRDPSDKRLSTSSRHAPATGRLSTTKPSLSACGQAT